ncbi:MAG: hypothetical protein PSX71_08600 [bacterium]|nr:hypothetical protein [bacterium]
MPVVPGYELPQVSPARLPNATAQGLTLRELSEGADGARQLGNIGRGLAGLSDDAQKERDQANSVILNDNVNKGRQAQMQQSQNFALLKGDDAFKPDPDTGLNPSDKFAGDLQDNLKGIGEALPNDALKQAWQAHAADLVTAFKTDAMHHGVQQWQQYQDNVSKGAIETAGQTLIQYPGDPEKIAGATQSIRDSVASLNKGQDKSVVEQAQADAVSVAQTSVVKSLLAGQSPDLANKYFTDHADDFTPAGKASLSEALAHATAGSAAISAVDSAMAKHVPQGADPTQGDTPINAVAIEADLREQFKDKPLALRAAIDEFHVRESAWKDTQNQYKAANVNSVMGMLADGKSLATVQQTQEWANLPGEARAQIQDHALSRANALTARSDASAARNDKALGLQNYDKYLDVAMNPDKLAAMTPDEVKALLPVLGTSLTHNLMESRAKLNNAADLKTAKMDADQFGSTALAFGIDTKDLTLSKEEKGNIALLKQNVDYVLTELQAAKKSPLTTQEKADAMRTEMARTVTVDPGFFSANKSVPVVQLSPEDAAHVVIPDADRAQITSAMNSMKIPVTEENIRRFYLRKVSPAGKVVTGGK